MLIYIVKFKYDYPVFVAYPEYQRQATKTGSSYLKKFPLIAIKKANGFQKISVKSYEKT